MASSVAVVAGDDDPVVAHGNPVSREVPVRLRDQVTRRLREQVETGRLAGKLPPEAELAARYRVSRKTLRAALLALADEGLVASVRGVGWFAVQRPGK